MAISQQTRQNPYCAARLRAAQQDYRLHSRELAAEELGISSSTLEKYERGIIKNMPPEAVVQMSNLYNAPELRNYYCSPGCLIGQIDRPALLNRSIEGVALSLTNHQDTLDEICKDLADILDDGVVDARETDRLSSMLPQLEKIAQLVDEMRVHIIRVCGGGTK